MIVDIDCSPYMGSEDLLYFHKFFESLDAPFFFHNRHNRKWHAAIPRFLELFLFWTPLNTSMFLLQHEIFGHGYRIRDLGTSRVEL